MRSLKVPCPSRSSGNGFRLPLSLLLCLALHLPATALAARPRDGAHPFIDWPAAWLARARLQDASLAGANLRMADLFKARLQGADLRGADLTGALLVKARLQGADLRGANLSVEPGALDGARLQGARINELTVLPAHWGETQAERIRKAQSLGMSLEPLLEGHREMFAELTAKVGCGGRNRRGRSVTEVPIASVYAPRERWEGKRNTELTGKWSGYIEMGPDGQEYEGTVTFTRTSTTPLVYQGVFHPIDHPEGDAAAVRLEIRAEPPTNRMLIRWHGQRWNQGNGWMLIDEAGDDLMAKLGYGFQNFFDLQMDLSRVEEDRR